MDFICDVLHVRNTKKTMRKKLWLVSFLLLVICKLDAQVTRNVPAQIIPDFKFFTLNNKPFTNGDLPEGKMIFFMFVDPGCNHCQHAVKTIGDQYPSFKQTSIYIISVFGTDQINGFMNTYGSKLKAQKNVTILQDKLDQFIVKFNPRKYPSMFLFSRERKLLDYEDTPETVFRIVNAIKKNGK